MPPCIFEWKPFVATDFVPFGFSPEEPMKIQHAVSITLSDIVYSISFDFEFVNCYCV